LNQLVFVEVGAISQKLGYSIAEVTERHLPLALEIEVLPNGLKVTEPYLALVLKIFIPFSH